MLEKRLLAQTLAKHAGQRLTIDLAREIVAEACMEVDRSITPRQFGFEHCGEYELRAERFAGNEAELEPMHAAYMKECRPHAVGLPFAWAEHREAERAGSLVMFVARHRYTHEMVGFMRVRVARQMHGYDKIVSDDMYFIKPEHRGIQLSTRLWRFAEKSMFDYGVREVTFDSLLITGAERMAKFLGYTPVATRFSKVAHDASDYSQVPTRHHQGVAHGSLAQD